MIKRLVLSLLRAYKKLLSPLLPRSCRFYPSCATYTYQAVEKWGLRKGLLLGLKRVTRCHPWNPGGVDPVP